MTTQATQTIQQFIEEQTSTGKIDKANASWRTQLPRFPEVSFEEGTSYHWQLDTSEGPIDIKLLPDVAPNHVANYIYLSQLGFFDGLIFHRVIDDFMAQGGCPEGSGRGGPGYRFDGEFSDKVRHVKAGLLSMANAGPGTDGSQFFITFRHTPHLDDNHTIFGEVVDGMETVKQLEAHGSRSGDPSKELKINKATVVTK